MRYIFLYILFILSFLVSDEVEIKTIPLSGIITDPKQEISGLDWYKNNLILLPENLNGFIFFIPKDELTKSINSNNPNPILPKKNIFKTPNYSKTIKGFEGFESIAFYNDNFIVTIEAKENDIMKSYLAWGKINYKTLNMNIPKENLKELKTPIQIKNMTYESSLIYNKNVIFLYEANGKNLQPIINQPMLSLNDNSISRIKYPNIEYRITDVTRIDHNNNFWAINYFWPGDKKHLKPAEDLIKIKPNINNSHNKSETVERLIEFNISDQQIKFTNTKPIQLKLDNKNSRNWEGIVRFENKGFIIATDKYPKMILAFVEYK